MIAVISPPILLQVTLLFCTKIDQTYVKEDMRCRSPYIITGIPIFIIIYLSFNGSVLHTLGCEEPLLYETACNILTMPFLLTVSV